MKGSVAAQIAAWIQPTLPADPPVPEHIWAQLAAYLELLGRWNQRMNLTAARNAQEMAQVHLAECLRCAQLLPPGIQTLLDFGSGAGLPGVPIQLMRPEIAVTLAESQSKKAMFLREAVRVLGMEQATVYAGRVEAMAIAQRFDGVTLRAVDQMDKALPAAAERVADNGWCAVLTTETQIEAVKKAVTGFAWKDAMAMMGSVQRVVLIGQKSS